MSDHSDPNQVERVARLQWLLLEDFERLLESGMMTPTDRATLTRFLRENGWKVDPNELPTSLREKLTSLVDPKQFDEEEDL